MKTLQQVLMKKKNYREIKKRIRMMKTQRSEIEEKNLIEEGKKKALIKLLDKMHKYKSMISYCLKCKKIQKG